MKCIYSFSTNLSYLYFPFLLLLSLILYSWLHYIGLNSFSCFLLLRSQCFVPSFRPWKSPNMVILILNVCDMLRDEVFFYGLTRKNFCYFLSEINYLKPSRMVQKCIVTELKTGPCFLNLGKSWLIIDTITNTWWSYRKWMWHERKPKQLLLLFIFIFLLQYILQFWMLYFYL